MPHTKYNIKTICSAIDGQFLLLADEKAEIEELLTDSRQLLYPAQTLFFALRTNKGNGHKYIYELYGKGVRNFVVSEKEILNFSKIKDANIIFVKDGLAALQRLAAFHRKKFSFPVIAITGSNGKTIVKEWAYFVLSAVYNIVRSPKSYNSQIGVPFSVWQMSGEHDLAIFEAGISTVGEMDKLREIIQPDVGIYTNIGVAHSEGFISEEQKAGEKLALFKHVKTLIYSNDYAQISNAIARAGLQKRIQLFDWSTKNEAKIKITEIKKKNKTTSISALFSGEEITVEIPFTDEASIENSIHVLALGLYLDMDRKIIVERMKKLPPVAMRLEMKEGINQCTVINDTYNADKKSITIALNFLHQQFPGQNKTLILSDILQSNEPDRELYSYIAALLKEKDVRRFIGIGPVLYKHQKLFEEIPEKKFYKDTQSYIADFDPGQYRNEGILIKGSRIFEFERITKLLQKKSHQTVLEINLKSLVDNLKFYRSLLLPETKIMVMVKAFSYGSGSFEIASTLEYHNADYLCVAYADEGVELRKAGIRLPVMVMNPGVESFEMMLQYDLEPEIYSFRVLKLFADAVSDSAQKGGGKIHIKFDTGMHRLGFYEDDLPELIRELQKNTQIKVQSVFSHLSAAGDPGQDAFTRQQYRHFHSTASRLEEGLGYPVLKHILNTAGILRFPEAQMDMVRLGIGLYGVEQLEEEKGKLANVTSLKTVISQIKTVKKGETIGYDRSFKAKRDMQIAIIPIGYADGLRRSLSNGKGQVYIRGKSAPVVGKICMDMTMIDITGIFCKEGERVVVFDGDHPVTQLAKQMDTIPYEVLTGISQRVKRVYFNE